MFRMWRVSTPLIQNFNQIRYQSTRRRFAPQEQTDYIKWLLLTIPVTSFGLGCWQVRRREWKVNLIKVLEEKTNSEPIDFPEDLWELNMLEYCPVKVTGHFLHDKEFVIGPRALIEKGGSMSGGSIISSSSKNQGFVVITPFQLKDRKEIIMINRGWVPPKMKMPADRPEGQINYEVEIIGTVRSNEKRPTFVPKNIPEKGMWFYKNLDEMAVIAGSAPVLLDARGTNDVLKGWPIPNQTRVTYRNEHFAYLVTWFSLSAFTTWMWVRKFVYKLR
ncbi:surfeit locus protein 1 [Arctopsyche grandis]|uniref:surfeit locus protein 1 n=1 Tax=Arctopsyche grandis TaxID=121162 RepID=UPI00406D89B4